jgi:Schlafen, AlbA_2
MTASNKVFGKDIKEITEDDLQALIDNEVAEKKILDYKKQLPFEYDTTSRKTKWDEREKVKFAKNVSSFANASGGILIYGIDDEKSGIAKTILGLPITKEDAEKVENAMMWVLRAKVKPPIEHIKGQPVPVTVGSKGGIVYVFEIPKSWRAPHSVAFNGGNGGYTFWARSDAKGKYPLDVGELQEAFNLSQTITERIRRFRQDRIAKIISGEAPASVHEDHQVILHLIPLNSFDPAKRHDLTTLERDYNILQPFSGSSADALLYNVDGLVNKKLPFKDLPVAYIQVFRNGIIESVDSGSFIASGQYSNTRFLWINHFEYCLIEALKKYLHIYNKLDVEPPIYIFLTLAGFLGVKLLDDAYEVPEAYAERNSPIDRDTVMIPEACIKNYNDPPPTILKDVLDSVWNACGKQKSLNYTEEGRYENRTKKRCEYF